MICTNAQITKIRRLLAKLPDDKYRERNLTRDQLHLWITHRSIQELIAKCWEALHKGLDNPLTALLDAEPKWQTTYELCWLSALYYQRLWELILLSEADLRRIAGQLELSYPFNSALELFEHIVQKKINADFEVCLQPYKEISSPKYEAKLRRAAKTLERGVSTVSGQRKKDVQLNGIVNDLRPRWKDHYWAMYTWCLCDFLAQSRSDIRLAVKGCDAVAVEMAKLKANGLHHTQSIAWKNGQRGFGQKGGSYFFPDPSVEQDDCFSYLDLDQDITSQVFNIS